MTEAELTLSFDHRILDGVGADAFWRVWPSSAKPRKSFSPPSSPDEATVLDAFTANPGDLSWDWPSVGGPNATSTTGPPRRKWFPGPGQRTAPNQQDGAPVAMPFARSPTFALSECCHDRLQCRGTSPQPRNEAFPSATFPATAPFRGPDRLCPARLKLTHRVGHHAQTVRDGRWSACPDFSYWDGSLVEA